MIKPTKEDIKNLCEENYYSQWARERFASFHDIISILGTPAYSSCEARALAERKEEWHEEETQALLVGSFVDSYYDGSLDKFKAEHPGIFTNKGELRAPYKQAEKMIERCERDELFKAAMSGEKQKILCCYVPELDLWCRAKLDSFDKDRFITDLKTTQNIYKPVKTKEGYYDFCTAYSYDKQLSFYRRLAEIIYGKQLPCYIAAVEKSDYPAIELINIDSDTLDEAYQSIVDNIDRFKAIVNGEITPYACNRCNYCNVSKKLKAPISLDELFLQ